MKINIHAGHNPDGKAACGAVGFIQESTEARKVKNEVAGLLRQMGHTVYDCTCENGTSQSDVLVKIVNACNAHDADLDVSIHFNAGAGDRAGNGKTTGAEAYVYSASSAAKPYADRICTAIAGLGYINRGTKINTNLYVLRKTKAPAMLVECCFVDDRDDVRLYDCRKMAEAIVYGITGQKAAQPESAPADKEAEESGAETAAGNAKQIYRVQAGAYSVRENAEKMQEKLKAAGFDAVITTESGEAVATGTPAKKEVTVGSTVRVNQGAKTYDGKTLKSFVYERNHQVQSISGDRVVITYQGTVVATVRKADLALV